jgi:hypothetical protein
MPPRLAKQYSGTSGHAYTAGTLTAVTAIDIKAAHTFPHMYLGADQCQAVHLFLAALPEPSDSAPLLAFLGALERTIALVTSALA